MNNQKQSVYKMIMFIKCINKKRGFKVFKYVGNYPSSTPFNLAVPFNNIRVELNTKLGNYPSSTPFNLAVPPPSFRLKA